MGAELKRHRLQAYFMQHQPRRLMIIGASGSGKSTLGKTLNSILPLPFYDLDDLNWLPHWQALPTAHLRQKVQAIVQQESWILAGNYSRTQDLSLAQADLVIWLDLSLWQSLQRVTRRCWRRSWTGELICNGNYETLRMSFLSRESLLLWVLKTHRAKRKRYSAWIESPGYPTVLRLQKPVEVSLMIAQMRQIQFVSEAACA